MASRGHGGLNNNRSVEGQEEKPDGMAFNWDKVVVSVYLLKSYQISS